MANRLAVLTYKELAEATREQWKRMSGALEHYRDNAEAQTVLGPFIQEVSQEREKLNQAMDDQMRLSRERDTANELPRHYGAYHKQPRKFVALIDYVMRVALQSRTPMDTPDRVSMLREFYCTDEMLDYIDRLGAQLEGTSTPWS